MESRRRPFPNRLAALILAGAALAAACATKRSTEPFSLVTLDDVQRMLGDPHVAIVDANPRDVYAAGHVPGAVWYRSGPFAAILPADKATQLVFYCASPS